MTGKVSSNYDFFVKTNTSKYKGEWLAISGRKIIAHGKKADEVYKAASKKIKSKNISLAKAPNAQMLVLGRTSVLFSIPAWNDFAVSV